MTYVPRKDKPKTFNAQYGKVPPQSIAMEEAVLGACMLEKDTFERVAGIIKSADYFYMDAHMKIWAAMMTLSAKGAHVDLLTITDALRRSDELEIIGGAYYLTKLTMSVITGAHSESHAYILAELYMKREVIRVSGNALGQAYDDSTDVFDLLETIESGITQLQVRNISKVAMNGTQLATLISDNVNTLLQSDSHLTGVTTGYNNLDFHTNGWQRTDLIILAARPSVGKTALCINFIINAVLAGKPTLFFSLEMGNLRITERIVSVLSRVEMWKISKPKQMNQTDMQSYMAAVQEVVNLPLYIDDEPEITLQTLRSKARKAKVKQKIEFIVIDYLQLMKGDGQLKESREQEISAISRGLKGIAKELDIPIIALSQLNRAVESRAGQKPMLSDLRESGAIEQDADMVMFLSRADYQKKEGEVDPMIKNTALLDIAKHRNGATIELAMEFDKMIQTWKEPATEFITPTHSVGRTPYKDDKTEDLPF